MTGLNLEDRGRVSGRAILGRFDAGGQFSITYDPSTIPVRAFKEFAAQMVPTLFPTLPKYMSAVGRASEMTDRIQCVLADVYAFR